jgi:hypothetical protein
VAGGGKAVRIENSLWAPLFTAVVEPNQFTATVEKVKQSESAGTLEEFFDQFTSPDLRHTAETLVARWVAAGYRRRLGPNHVVLEPADSTSRGSAPALSDRPPIRQAVSRPPAPMATQPPRSRAG